MKRILIVAVATSSIFISSCSSTSSDKENSIFDALKAITKTKYNTVEVAGAYSMELPDFMKSTNSLNESASLQYDNIYKEKYIIVIDEPKQDFVDIYKELGEYDENASIIDNYTNVQVGFFTEEVKIVTKSDISKLSFNGLKARKIDIDANIESVPQSISYFLGYVEGKENLYTVMAWTLADKKSDFEKEAMHMLKSLKEL